MQPLLQQAGGSCCTNRVRVLRCPRFHDKQVEMKKTQIWISDKKYKIRNKCNTKLAATNRNFEGAFLPGVRARFRTWTSFCMASARKPSYVEGSSYRDPKTDLAQERERDLAQSVLIQKSCTSDPTGSWYKLFKRIFTQRSDTSDPTESVRQEPQSILMQVVEQEPGTEISHNWSDRILMQVVQKDHWQKLLNRTLIQRRAQEVLQIPDASGQKASS